MIKQALNNKLIKNIILIASGTAGAQAIALLLVPVITRTYGPEVYGIYGTILATIGVMGTFSALSYPIAIVLPKYDDTAKGLMKLSGLVAITLSFLTFCVLFLFGDTLLTALNISQLIPLKYFIPLMMFLTAYQSIAEQWLVRKEQFKDIAKISVGHSIINFGGQALLSLFIPLAITIVSIHSAAIALRATLMLMVADGLNKDKDKDKDISLKKVAYEYKDFPIFRTPQTVLDAISQSLPVLMVASFSGPIVAGYYTLNKTALSVPGQLIANSVQSVFYPHFNKAYLDREPLFKPLITSMKWLAIVSFLPLSIVMILGPSLFGLVFGEDWYDAGIYAQWMAVATFFTIISRPAISAISVFNLQAWFLKFEIFSLISRASALSLGFLYFESALYAIALYSCAAGCLNLLISIKTLHYSIILDKSLQA